MPTYSYKCKECALEFDIVQRIVDDTLKDCPDCKKPSLKKVIKPGDGGFALKGKGWFKSGGY
jgi:putative FmdB family regulatory protein